jgi:hypothetical protein
MGSRFGEASSQINASPGKDSERFCSLDIARRTVTDVQKAGRSMHAVSTSSLRPQVFLPYFRLNSVTAKTKSVSRLELQSVMSLLDAATEGAGELPDVARPSAQSWHT